MCYMIHLRIVIKYRDIYVYASINLYMYVQIHFQTEIKSFPRPLQYNFIPVTQT